jgi:hypothetical protein
MKKLLAFLIAFAFVASLAADAFAQRDPAEELASVRGYLKTLDVKIIKYKKMKGTKAAATLKQLRTDKVATLKRLAVLKAQAEAATMAPPPPPPMAPLPPPPAPVVTKPAPVAGLFGMGYNAVISGNYLMTGKGKLPGALGARGDLLLGDLGGIGASMGLSLNWRVGLQAVYGTDNQNKLIQALPLCVDAVLSMPMGKDMEAYAGGGPNWTLYGTGSKMGTYGIQAYVGIKKDMGLGRSFGLGKTGVELGYSVVRAGGTTPTRSAKGVTLTVVQDLAL